MSMPNETTARRLKEAAGADGWSEDPREIAPHLVELRGRWTGRTPLLLKPSDTQAVARILAVCNETGTAVVPQGGNTGLVGGQVPTRGEVLLSLERMTRIRTISPGRRSLDRGGGRRARSARSRRPTKPDACFR